MSFLRICFAAAAFAAVAQATLVINSVNVVGNGTSTIQFTSTDPQNDPQSFTVELLNTELFHNTFAVLNNVPSTSGMASFETPQIPPGPDYFLQLVANNNMSDVFATSPAFTVQENDVNKTSSKSSSPSSSGLNGSSSGLSPTSVSNSFVTPSVTSPGSVTPVASQPPSGSNSAGSSTPPSSATNAVFTNGASSSTAPISLLLAGIAFAFF